MLITKLAAVGLSLGVLTALGGYAYANGQDVPGQLCERSANSIAGVINYDTDGVRNDDTQSGTFLLVECPIVLYGGSGRSLYIGGTDQNSSANFTCTAVAQDVNLGNVSMPSITITTGTYTNGTIGSFSIPDNVAKLVLQCGIPPTQSGAVSKISDFWIQN